MTGIADSGRSGKLNGPPSLEGPTRCSHSSHTPEWLKGSRKQALEIFR
jgi:hypothetical protein